MKNIFDERKVRDALVQSWSIRSASQWTPENPAAGQCNVTAAVIHDLYGGKVLRTKLPEGFHYYNWLDGRAIDLTDSQFAEPISYDHEMSDRDAALEGIKAAEFEALRSALMQNLG